MSIHQALPFHEGEINVHRALHVSPPNNPTSPFLSPFAARVLQRSPLIALGITDSQGRPWTSLWGGSPAFARPIAPSIIAINSAVGRTLDPVIKELLGSDADGEVVQGGEKGPLISGLAIDLDARLRVKFSGRMVAGALMEPEKGSGAAEVHLVMKIERSLGYCPKYLNRKTIFPTSPTPTLLSTTLPLPPFAVDLIYTADLFFLSSSHPVSPSTNHRGGPPGFLRILSNTPTSLILVYPEYSGNNLYQTLGNYRLSPLASLLIPDFSTGNALYLTGRVDILIGPAAAAVLPHTNLAIKFTVDELRFVGAALPFRAHPGELSPYNPRLRLLANERPAPSAASNTSYTATLLSQTPLSPTISRFRFRLDKLARWRGGQYVVFDFSDEFDVGYSHMRDDDPRSLNDDFIRTFTVSSPPPTEEPTEFEITIRKVGRATEFLFRQSKASRLTVLVSGFGGEFVVGRGEKKAYIAAGVGITPFLAMMGEKIEEGVDVFWSVKEADLGLVKDTLDRVEGLGRALRLFVTGAEAEGKLEGRVDKGSLLQRIVSEGGVVWERRMVKGDLMTKEKGGTKWLLCAGKSFRGGVLGWLEGESVMFEDFDF